MKVYKIYSKSQHISYYISIRLNYMSILFNFVALHDKYTKYIHNRYTHSCPTGYIHIYYTNATLSYYMLLSLRI